MPSYLDSPLMRGGRMNPFRTYSNYIYPKTIDQVLIWAEWFWERNAKYRTCIQKCISYFVSGINVVQMDKKEAADSQAVESLHDMLIDDYDLLNLINTVGVELAAMGNVFVSCERPLSRWLLCPDCDWMVALKQLTKGIEFDWDGKQFIGTCPKCGHKVVYNIHDDPTTDEYGRKVRFIFRAPQDMFVQYNRLTDSFQYFYKIPDDIKNAIKRGEMAYLLNTPKAFLDAVHQDGVVKFPDDMFFAARTRTLTPLDERYKGWGVPLFMTSFDNFIRLQHLDKFNEAVTMDYIAPVRIISPRPQNIAASAHDQNRMPIGGGQFMSFIQNGIKRVKDNPTTWLVSPTPVEYQLIGGEAKELTPVDLMEWYVTQILSDMGIPQEFRQTTFQVVAPSMGMRMFERQWRPNTKPMDAFTRWAGEKICDYEKMANMRVTLDITSFVEDDMNKQMLFQLMTGGQISKTNVLKTLGVDFEEDLKMRINEMKKEREQFAKEDKAQQDQEMVGSVFPPQGIAGVMQAQGVMDAQMAAMQPQQPQQPAGPMGAAPAPAPVPASDTEGGGQPLGSVWEQGAQEAQRLYNAPPNVRRQELVNMKATNPELHAAVTQQLQNMRQQVASDAVAQSQMPQPQ
jgi:hypothetical protein